MSIWSILSRNAVQGSRTRGPTDEVPFPEGFRGALRHILEECTGCGVCAYVCAPAAIHFVASGQGSTVWSYFAGQCTFCARCAEYCPTGALVFDRRAPPVTGSPSQHRLAHAVVFPPCTRCGRPVLPMPAKLFSRLYGGAVAEELQARWRLCERCRGRATAESMKSQAGG